MYVNTYMVQPWPTKCIYVYPGDLTFAYGWLESVLSPSHMYMLPLHVHVPPDQRPALPENKMNHIPYINIKRQQVQILGEFLFSIQKSAFVKSTCIVFHFPPAPPANFGKPFPTRLYSNYMYI